ncbi:MAG: hypothetical protein ACT4RN_17575 [Pseudonocardia sp.]
MPHTFLKPTKILRTALALLQREIVLPRTVWSYGRAHFAGAKDDTVTLRLPALLTARDYEWRTRNNPIQVADLTERGVDIKLNRHPEVETRAATSSAAPAVAVVRVAAVPRIQPAQGARPRLVHPRSRRVRLHRRLGNRRRFR